LSVNDAESGPRRPGRPRDARHDRAILEATMALLSEGGYGRLTIDGVAARAGVGRPTIYRRWPSKQALVVAALLDAPQIQVPEADTGSLRGDLVKVLRHQITLMNRPENRRVTAALVADLAADPELGEKYVNEYLVPRRAAVWRVLQRGVARGELAADADLGLAYEMLFGPLFMRSVIWGHHLGRDVAEKLVDAVLAAFAAA
jgi:AcrR family transcriptional regulator